MTRTLAMVIVLVAGCGTAAPVATPTAAPTVTATAAPSTPSATPVVLTSLSPGVEAGGSTWSASADFSNSTVGDRFLFQCPPGGTEYAIWGSGTYTSDSSVCTAAVHSGWIDFFSGGSVVIEMRPGRESYTGSEHNGVTSRDYSSWGSSFAFAAALPSSTATPTGPPTSEPAGSTGTLSPAAAALLLHIPQHMRGDCMEVTSFDAGVLVGIQCINIPGVDGYVVYTSFDNSTNLQDSFFGNFDFFGEGVDDERDDCAIGPSLIAYERDGIAEGRRFCNNYESEPGAIISFWFDDGLLIEVTLVVYDATFAGTNELALSAGPNP